MEVKQSLSHTGKRKSSKISGLFETEKKEIQATFFKGFNDEQIEAVVSGKPELIAHKEKKSSKVCDPCPI